MFDFRGELEKTKREKPVNYAEAKAESILKDVIRYFQEKEYVNFGKIKYLKFYCKDADICVETPRGTIVSRRAVPNNRTGVFAKLRSEMAKAYGEAAFINNDLTTFSVKI